VRAASVCGSDTHGYTGQGGRRVPPLVMGHEASGEVVAIGSDVTNVRPGDRIFVTGNPIKEVIDHYAENRVLYSVRGDADVDTVTDDLLRALASIRAAV